MRTHGINLSITSMSWSLTTQFEIWKLSPTSIDEPVTDLVLHVQLPILGAYGGQDFSLTWLIVNPVWAINHCLSSSVG